MMWLVQLALRRPLTIAVMALLMLVLGLLSFHQMNVDIFPAIKLPVVMVVWNYPGLPAFQMERRMVWISERAYSTTVNDIEHIESQSINGLGILKVYFHPGADVGGAIAQINAVSETILSNLPRGTQPPQIIAYDASNLPVAQLNMFSDRLSEQQLFDYGLNFVRIQLFTIPGFSTPAPLGGVQRAVMVNLDPLRLYAQGLSPQDVGQTLANTNVVIPAGTAKMGNYEYDIDLNMSPDTVAAFNQLPVKVVGQAPVLLRDVAPVSDTHQPQTNVVRVNGRRGTFLMVIKHADASTLAVVDAVRDRLPRLLASLPKRLEGLKLALTFDQSKFVREALWEVVRESVIAALLVSLMVLLFLGSARSMLIVIASIPLSILTAIIGLRLSGQTINTMTLGGVALAVGMLVDDATVEVENIHRNHAMGKPILTAILDGASQIATPTLVGTLSICIVFFPVVLLSGVAKYLFTPLALAVVFAMLTSYLLSRTLVPAMASYLVRDEHGTEANNEGGSWSRLTAGFQRGFERLRRGYTGLLARMISGRAITLAGATLLVVLSFALVKVVGEDFFPTVDAGMMRLHVRAPTGTRIERTEQIVDDIEHMVRDAVPAADLETVSDNIGLPVSFNLAFYQTDSVGSMDADILIQLKEKHRPTAVYEEDIRRRLRAQFPNVTAYFQPADLVGQVLNFGLPSAIDVQISGNDLDGNYQLASRLQDTVRTIPGLNDLRIAEPLDRPAFHVDIDRAKALELGISEQQAAASLLTALNGNSLIQPSFWLDPVSGVNYSVISQVPQEDVSTVQSLANLPITGGAPNTQPQLLANIAQIKHGLDPAVINHYTLQRVIDVNASVSGRDLGSASAAVQQAISRLGPLPRGASIVVRGRSQAMRTSFQTLEFGILLAAVLVYLLMVANFQSWLEPMIIMLAVPGALAGALWMLALTGTTINVESLMGMIMAVGVGVANGNLLVIFANELREEGYSAVDAALEAGRIRFRPIVMTALAMILGMLPMAFGFGSGAELNAPLGRAVIGGLLAATATTLFVVPTVYSIFGRQVTTKRERDERVDAALRHQFPGLDHV
jgi:multidrug efflux pump subunit AcrB